MSRNAGSSESAVVAAASNKRSIAAWSRSISGTPRRGADGITNPPLGWGPGEQTTLARRIFSEGHAVDGDEDEPTPKLTETGGLSLISLKHVASRGPAGLPQARSARRISQRRSRAALRKGPFPETRDRPRQR